MKIVQPIRDMDVLMRCYDIARQPLQTQRQLHPQKGKTWSSF